MNPTPTYELERRITAAWPVEAWLDAHVVLGVSGGPDSVAMLRAMMSVKVNVGGQGRLFAAHFNHAARGADADADQDWLAALCQRLNISLETARADPGMYASSTGDGWEAAARAARYEFLTQVAQTLGARFVAVAHTADDQVETVLHRILRGTGLAGLAGMRPSRPLSSSVALVRPLLRARRSEVLEYLASIGQDYRTDPTNRDTRRTRNRLRNELLPHLRGRYNIAVDEALMRLAAQADETQQVIDGVVAELVRDCVVVERSTQLTADNKGLRVRLNCDRLRVAPMLLVREVCRAAWRDAGWPMQAMGFGEWQSIAELVHGRREVPINLPGGVQARCVKRTLLFEVGT
jgi:tRNA(Ile)-lysidine synthase